MKRTTKYVALDVHQATTVASVREEGGRVIARSIFPTEEQALLDFFRGMRGSIHVTFEEGAQVRGAVSREAFARPTVCRGTQLTLGPPAEPEEASGRPPWPSLR